MFPVCSTYLEQSVVMLRDVYLHQKASSPLSPLRRCLLYHPQTERIHSTWTRSILVVWMLLSSAISRTCCEQSCIRAGYCDHSEVRDFCECTRPLIIVEVLRHCLTTDLALPMQATCVSLSIHCLNSVSRNCTNSDTMFCSRCCSRYSPPNPRNPRCVLR